MKTQMDIDLRIDQEGSRGYMWHMIAEGRGDFLVSANTYLTVLDAEDGAMDLVEELRSAEINVVVEHPNDITDDVIDGKAPRPWGHEGLVQYAPKTFYIRQDHRWMQEVEDANRDEMDCWYGVLVMTGPMAAEGYTYYGNLATLKGLGEWLTKTKFDVKNIDIETQRLDSKMEDNDEEKSE